MFFNVFQRFSTFFNVFQRFSTFFNVFQHFSTFFNVFQHFSMFFNVFQGFSRFSKAFQGCSRLFMVVQGVSRCVKVFQGFSRFFKVFKDFQGLFFIGFKFCSLRVLMVSSKCSMVWWFFKIFKDFDAFQGWPKHYPSQPKKCSEMSTFATFCTHLCLLHYFSRLFKECWGRFHLRKKCDVVVQFQKNYGCLPLLNNWGHLTCKTII
jgi:hypothetical protein